MMIPTNQPKCLKSPRSFSVSSTYLNTFNTFFFVVSHYHPFEPAQLPCNFSLNFLSSREVKQKNKKTDTAKWVKTTTNYALDTKHTHTLTQVKQKWILLQDNATFYFSRN